VKWYLATYPPKISQTGSNKRSWPHMYPQNKMYTLTERKRHNFVQLNILIHIL